MDKNTYTIYQLMDLAENKPFGSDELRACDEAVYQTRNMCNMGERATVDEIVAKAVECVIRFDNRGNIIGAGRIPI